MKFRPVTWLCICTNSLALENRCHYQKNNGYMFPPFSDLRIEVAVKQKSSEIRDSHLLLITWGFTLLFSDMFTWHLGHGWPGGVLSDAWQLHEISRRFAARVLRHGSTVFWGSYENLQLLVPSQRSRRSPSCKGPLTPSEIEREREFFALIFVALDMNSKLNFLSSHLEARSLSRSLSLSVN